MICRVTNPLSEAVDYTGTMTFTLGQRAAVVGGGAERGTVDVVGNEIRWGGFTLGPGESAEANARVAVTPTETDAGQLVVVFTSTRTTARLASGGFVDITAGPLTSAAVPGIGNGGVVTSGGFVQPTATPPTAAQPPAAQPAPRPAAAPAGALPRVGAAVTGKPRDRLGAALALGTMMIIGLGALAVRRVHRSS